MSTKNDFTGSAFTYNYNLDVITNGSECTEATIFLTVRRHGRGAKAGVLAQYSVVGLCESTARLVGDQKFQWNQTRAIFCHSELKGGGCWGLPSLLWMLHHAGAARLTVVSYDPANARNIEQVVDLLEYHRQSHPKVLIGEIPSSPSWWKIYEDEYLVAHARGNGSQQNHSTIYLFTCRLHSEKNYTIAFISSSIELETLQSLWRSKQEILCLDGEDTPISIRLVLTRYSRECPRGSDGLRQFVSICKKLFLDPPVLVMNSSLPRDSRILIRAHNLIKHWQTHFPDHFVCRDAHTEQMSYTNNDDPAVYLLQSCTTVCCKELLEFIDRKPTIIDRLHNLAAPEPAYLESLKEFLSPKSMELSSTTYDDNEIEIESISSSASADQDDKACLTAHLLVLGTGCASPSPIRGSSGYALLLPTFTDHSQMSNNFHMTAIIDCGEGILTMLWRHLPLKTAQTFAVDTFDDNLLQIRFIWISHAHWDHYGGLPALLHAIAMARQRQSQRQDSCDETHQAKRVKRESLLHSVPMVIAPRRVLKYLDLALDCRNGVRHGSTLFRGVLHIDTNTWWPYMSNIAIELNSSKQIQALSYNPFTFWENVKVHHSCSEAYGFVMGLHIPKTRDSRLITDVAPAMICFSGDTLPCQHLAKRCVFHSNRCKDSLSLLIHESTFDDDERQMSLRKKHSTKADAVKIALQVAASRVLLTHFSQRYDKYPPMPLPETNNAKLRIAFALDGMLLPLSSSKVT